MKLFATEKEQDILAEVTDVLSSVVKIWDKLPQERTQTDHDYVRLVAKPLVKRINKEHLIP